LVGHTETLRDRRRELSDDDLDTCIAAIDRQAQRLTALVEDLLAAAMADAGQTALAPEAVDVPAAVHDALTDVRFDRGHEVMVSIPDAVAPAAADASALRRVLVNLISNAARYSPARSRIDIRVDDHGGEIAVSVQDRGRGIDPGEVSQLFTKFRRGPNATPASCGIGLYVVQQLVDAMGGRITVDSQPGAGSRFTVLLPVAAPVVAAPPAFDVEVGSAA
jgi:signal transduction histidine kinase